MNIIENIKTQAIENGKQVVFKSRVGQLSYLQLWNKSEQIAQWIKENVSGKNEANPIVIYGHKNPLMLASFLGSTKSGRTYCPVDRCMPIERIEDIIETVENEYVLMTENLVERICKEDSQRVSEVEKVNEYTYKMSNVNFIDVNALLDVVFEEKDDTVLENVSEDSYLKQDGVYYIIFTSGSTGKPKGVQITRSSLENYLDWSTEVGDSIGAKHGKNFLNQAPYSFDLSVMDTYTSLVSGGTLVSVDKELQQDTAALVSYIKENKVNYWVSTPSFAAMCLSEPSYSEEELESLKFFMFCGETLSKETSEKLMERFPKAKIINTYGPTESTVAVTSIEVTKELLEDEKTIPIGYEKHGTEILILADSTEGQEVKLAKSDEIGELVILGNTLSIGYYKNPVKTAEAFKTIIYKGREVPAYFTGDAGYKNKDGMIFFLGRIDRQVKLHGYRIELGDIESNLTKIKEITQAAVIPKKVDGVIKQLVAFIVSDKLNEDYDSRKYVRNQLQEMIPKYMVPKKIVVLDKMPLTNNGKIDYKRMETLV